MKQLSIAVAAAASALVLISGCSGASNNGGNTTCKDFLAMRDNDKDAAVARMLKEREGRNASTGDIEAKRMILVGFCQPTDKQDSKISELA
jgi:acid stress chaperone HdeA